MTTNNFTDNFTDNFTISPSYAPIITNDTGKYIAIIIITILYIILFVIVIASIYLTSSCYSRKRAYKHIQRIENDFSI